MYKKFKEKAKCIKNCCQQQAPESINHAITQKILVFVILYILEKQDIEFYIIRSLGLHLSAFDIMSQMFIEITTLKNMDCFCHVIYTKIYYSSITKVERKAWKT